MSNVDKIIESVIPSTTVKNWICETKHKFEFSEILSLIWNSDLNLKEKLQTLQKLKSLDSLKEYGIKNPNTAIRRLNYIINDVQSVIDFAYELDNGYVVELSYYYIDDIECEEYKSIVVENMTTLKKILKSKDIECAIGDAVVNLIDLSTGDVHVKYYLTEDNEPYDFRLLSNTCRFKDNCYMALHKPWELDSYIKLPVDFHIGDRVKLYNKEEIYIVGCDNTPYDDVNKSLDVVDTNLMVIPEEVFDKDKDYKQQLLDENKDYIRMGISKLYSKHEHLPITCIERV